jgi:hypothetical protein
VVGNAGSDTIFFTGDSVGTTVLGGAAASLVTGTGDLNSTYVLGGASNDLFEFGGSVTSSTILGGAGADIATIAGTVTLSTVMGGAGADTLVFSSLATGSSVAGGLGDDSILFAATHTGAAGLGGSATNMGTTYYFGTNSGSDTLSFGGQSGTGFTNGTIVPLTIGADTAGLGAGFTQVAVTTSGGSTYTQFSGNGQTLTILGTNTNVAMVNATGSVVSSFEL